MCTADVLQLPGHPLRELASNVTQLIQLDKEIATQHQPHDRSKRADSVKELRTRIELARQSLDRLERDAGEGYPLPYA